MKTKSKSELIQEAMMNVDMKSVVKRGKDNQEMVAK